MGVKVNEKECHTLTMAEGGNEGVHAENILEQQEEKDLALTSTMYSPATCMH
jgi:hypothetical protein